MKKILQFRSYLFLMALMVFSFSSCDNEDDGATDKSEEAQSTIVETAQNTDALASLVAALTKADENDDSDLVATLNGKGTFTVFAPTNDAFTDLLNDLDDFDSLDDFNTPEKRAILATILKYHVVSGIAAESTDLEDEQKISTVQGEDVTVRLEDGRVFIDDATDIDAEVIIADVNTSNGIVHVINKVLVPQEIINALNGNESTLVDIVVATETLSILEQAVIKAGLVDTLNSEGPFTVFAPTDDAFETLFMILGDTYNTLDDFDSEEEMELLKNVLLYHVVPAKVLKANLEAGDVPTAFTDNSLTIIEKDGTFVIGDASEIKANITATDILASNGVAHTIDKVLLPQAAIDFAASIQLKNIVEIAIETEDLSLLVKALQTANAGLVETLSGKGPFTVFAPTNAAFADLLDVLGDGYNGLSDFNSQEEIDLLVDILTYHVISGTAAFSSNLEDEQQIPTVFGDVLEIDLDGDSIEIIDASDNNATVVIKDVAASNGVVHVIDKVLLPQVALDFVAKLQLKNIVEIAIETDDLDLLVQALQTANAGLVETLSGDGPFTVFAPTNKAFKNLLNLLGDDFNSLSDFDTQDERDLLVTVLTYHVIAGKAAFSDDLNNGDQIATFQGENVGINIKNSTIHVEDATDANATVVVEDVEASNGVVHIIDKVLLPQAALDILFPPTPNIVQLAQSVDDLSLLVAALIQADAGLVDALSGDGPFTVFAPTNEAFENLLHNLGSQYNSLEDFDTAEERALLAKLLTYHVISDQAITSSELTGHKVLKTLQGENIEAIGGHPIKIRDKTHDLAKVIGADNEASNGIVHIIDKVLVPQEIIDALH
ncbi:uncharacterized protein HME9304_02642 [Flagellimonas maritima]|uniref:FAS1 domain-containing protein n=1 Tax=Flagellimonas maritima TaxID=1383885 RepID=A0A2Z4LUN4_9FLAO|nr:fasciclin domain-containing protein [Allomuricauda aurantiaca]AWX45615.1 uncharacterized protein HME9304_02642 [Allomuricauda aurantiaca]